VYSVYTQCIHIQYFHINTHSIYTLPAFWVSNIAVGCQGRLCVYIFSMLTSTGSVYMKAVCMYSIYTVYTQLCSRTRVKNWNWMDTLFQYGLTAFIFHMHISNYYYFLCLGFLVSCVKCIFSIFTSKQYIHTICFLSVKSCCWASKNTHTHTLTHTHTNSKLWGVK